MPFFEPLPDPVPEPARAPRQYFSWPGRRPDNWVPGAVSWALPLATTEDTALALVGGAVYPQGLELRVVVRLRPGTEEDHLERGGLRTHRNPVEGLRLGALMPDGSKVLTDDGPVYPWPGAGGPRWHLQSCGGGGGGLSYEQGFWLWPLPEAGRMEFVCQWDRRAVPESRVGVDAGQLAAAAACAVELWPMPDPPPDESGSGHHSYGSL